MQNKHRKNITANISNKGTGIPSQNTSENTLTDLPLNVIEQALPFPLGYSHKQKYWLSHFYDDGRHIRCLVHNADGMVDATITRPDIEKHNLEEWGLYEVTIVLLKTADSCKAEILSLNLCSFLETDLRYVPRALCPIPAKLDELRQLVQFIQHKSLRMLVSLVYGKPHIYERFLKAYGSRDSYTYPGGLLARTVAANKDGLPNAGRGRYCLN